MPFTCEHPGCGRSYQRKEHLNRHMKDHNAVRSFKCPACDAKFSRGDTLRRHMTLHGPRASGPLPGRVAQACVSCHRSKTRCDGKEPSCTQCSSKGRSCVYPQRSAAGQQQTSEKAGGEVEVEAGGDHDHDHQIDPSLAGPAPAPGPPIPIDGVLPIEIDIDLDINMDVVASMAQPPPMLPTAEIIPCDHPGRLDVDSSSIAGLPYFLPPQPLLAAAAATPEQPSVMTPWFRRLRDVFFERIHPHWPLLHRKTFGERPLPEMLTRAVVVAGLLLEGSPESKRLGTEHHTRLLQEARSKAEILLGKARQGKINSPTLQLLPHLQAIFIAMLLCPYRLDKSLDVAVEMSPVMAEVFSLVGVYDQARINAELPMLPDDPHTWLPKEMYQRLALLHLKLHLCLGVTMTAIFPWRSLDSTTVHPGMLDVHVPVPRHFWDMESPPQWSPGDGAADPAIEAAMLVSAVAARAVAAQSSGPLLPILLWDRNLAMSLGCWCSRPEGESDSAFGKRLRPFLHAALGIGVGIIPLT